MALSFTIAAGPRQLSHSQVRLPPFYCVRFDTPPTWRARSPYLYPPGTGWPGYTPRHWVPSSSRHTTRGDTVESFDPASTWATELIAPTLLVITSRHGLCRKRPVFSSNSVFAYSVCRGNVFTEPFPRNGRCLFLSLEVAA
jgi:hypothetical protein